MIQQILELVRNQLNDHLLSVDARGKDWVVLSNVVDHERRPVQEARDAVVMTLVNIVSEAVVSHQAPLARTSAASLPAVRPPLHMTMSLLFLANFSGDQYSLGLRRISDIIRFFHRNPLIRCGVMPDLDPGIDRFPIEMMNLDPRDIGHVTGALGITYLPSVCYRVRALPFAGGMTQAESAAFTPQTPAAPAP